MKRLMMMMCAVVGAVAVSTSAYAECSALLANSRLQDEQGESRSSFIAFQSYYVYALGTAGQLPSVQVRADVIGVGADGFTPCTIRFAGVKERTDPLGIAEDVIQPTIAAKYRAFDNGLEGDCPRQFSLGFQECDVRARVAFISATSIFDAKVVEAVVELQIPIPYPGYDPNFSLPPGNYNIDINSFLDVDNLFFGF